MASKLERSWEYLKLLQLSQRLEKDAYEALGKAAVRPTPENVDEARLISIELEMVVKELMDILNNWEADNERNQ